MISNEHARRLRARGLEWRPASGDAFRIEGDEFEGDVFTVSEMTIEAHEFDTGTILGFNGTTEWALDSVALESALWLPREDQLRERLGDRFLALQRIDDGGHAVTVRSDDGPPRSFEAADAADAYALALLALLGVPQA
ncbi:hypothetical protein [Compostimonas suwonensis]|uniref:Pilus assembly protein CpaE n=1 Tax=Compostimonas suwonensis TaxID=1048394 RepID=A0A2M9BU33_9MICO|nr:hypothetical protein [Compostimonas suwonensis]PJJ61466.1 hypothetical protein CLV54_2411 [Compostimonas suwonensis]